MAKISLDLSNIEVEQGDLKDRKLAELAAPLPSVSKAKENNLRSAPRVQFSFTNVPKPIKDAFAKEAVKRKITQKDLLYEALRQIGIDIPDEVLIDRRKLT